ncbi:hypothetical protein [Sneathiella glossodoripedis]|uniref:hypothetical protein n=1 Tax=Sneathiella glossodoripedis TaxID=418853 RepID=UPI0018FFA587|nr:hypothetical protein [Sneathiella glossodoripedis]
MLHCSGKLEEMQQVAPNCPGLEAKTISRIEAGWRRLDDLCDGADSNLRYDGAAMRAELDALLQQD